MLESLLQTLVHVLLPAPLLLLLELLDALGHALAGLLYHRFELAIDQSSVFERGFTRVDSLTLVAGNDSADPTKDAIKVSEAVDSSIGVGDEIEVVLTIGAGAVQTMQTEIRAISQDRKRLELTTSLAADPTTATITRTPISPATGTRRATGSGMRTWGGWARRGSCRWGRTA